MKSKNKIGRREFLVSSSSLTVLATGVLGSAGGFSAKAPAPAYGRMERVTLDLGHRASRSGPVTELADGTLLWVTTEPEAPYLAKVMWPISRLMLRRSTDGGRSWGAAQHLAQGTKEYSLLSHSMRRLSSGRILHIYSRYSGYDYETGTPAKSLNQIYFQISEDGGETWSEPSHLPTGERYQGDTLSTEQLRDGRVIYPFCFLTDVKSQFAVSVMYSDDEGKTWTRSPSILLTSGGGFESGASEPTVVELPGGRLWMLIRAQTGFLWESFSNDRGKTWSKANQTSLPSSNAPATACRLRNGEIAVAWNNHVESNYARQSLVLGITRDGKKFEGLREIDFTDFPDNDGEPPHHVTYPYLAEAKDGRMIVSYNKGRWDRHNRQVVALVTPDWVRERSEIADFSDGRTGWHTVNPGPELKAAVERYVSPDDKTLWLEILQNPKSKKPTGITRNIPMVVDGKINLTIQVPRSEAYVLLRDSLFEPGVLDEACVRIRFANGQIFFGAGKEGRIQNDRRGRLTTSYTFLSHQIREEKLYPLSFKSDDVLNISLDCKTAQNKVELSVNSGPAVEIEIAKILGLSFMALSVANGGQLRLQTIKTTLR